MGFRNRNEPPPDNIPDLPWDPKTALRTTVTNAYGKINFINVEHIGGKKPAKVIVSYCKSLCLSTSTHLKFQCRVSAKVINPKGSKAILKNCLMNILSVCWAKFHMPMVAHVSVNFSNRNQLTCIGQRISISQNNKSIWDYFLLTKKNYNIEVETVLADSWNWSYLHCFWLFHI